MKLTLAQQEALVRVARGEWNTNLKADGQRWSRSVGAVTLEVLVTRDLVKRLLLGYYRGVSAFDYVLTEEGEAQLRTFAGREDEEAGIARRTVVLKAAREYTRARKVEEAWRRTSVQMSRMPWGGRTGEAERTLEGAPTPDELIEMVHASNPAWGEFLRLLFGEQGPKTPE